MLKRGLVALHINKNACTHLSAFRMRNAELRIALPFALSLILIDEMRRHSEAKKKALCWLKLGSRSPSGEGVACNLRILGDGKVERVSMDRSQ